MKCSVKSYFTSICSDPDFQDQKIFLSISVKIMHSIYFQLCLAIMEEVVGAVGVAVGVEVEEVLHPVSVEERLVYGMQNTHRSEKKREKGTLEIERLSLCLHDENHLRRLMEEINLNSAITGGPVVGEQMLNNNNNNNLFEHRNEKVDDDLYRKGQDKEGSLDIKYKEILEFRRKLPSYKMQYEILDMVDRNCVSLISGETGCGKTTQVAQFILDSYIQRKQGSMCNIICTQPRRIGAISVAERVASERNEQVGESCGYQIRLEEKFRGLLFRAFRGN